MRIQFYELSCTVWHIADIFYGDINHICTPDKQLTVCFVVAYFTQMFFSIVLLRKSKADVLMKLEKVCRH